METKFQTSFIPKKPLVIDQKTPANNRGGGGTSIMMVIATILFLLSVGGAVFTVVWKNVLIQAQENDKKQLAKSEERFDISSIENLKRISNKIELSKRLLKNHIDVAEVFSIISQLTVENLRFNKFIFTGPEKEGDDVKVTMEGVAKNYNTIAFQSDVLSPAGKYGRNKILKNPVFSNLIEGTSGDVSFVFNATIGSPDLSYEKILNAELQSENADSTTPKNP